MWDRHAQSTHAAQSFYTVAQLVKKFPVFCNSTVQCRIYNSPPQDLKLATLIKSTQPPAFWNMSEFILPYMRSPKRFPQLPITVLYSQTYTFTVTKFRQHQYRISWWKSGVDVWTKNSSIVTCKDALYHTWWSIFLLGTSSRNIRYGRISNREVPKLGQI